MIYRQDAATGYLVLFYDGPTPPAGIFDDFVAIQALSSDLQIRSFASYIQSLAPFAPIDPGTNAYWGSINFLDYPVEFQEYVQEVTRVRSKLTIIHRRATDSAIGRDIVAYCARPELLDVMVH